MGRYGIASESVVSTRPMICRSNYHKDDCRWANTLNKIMQAIGASLKIYLFQAQKTSKVKLIPVKARKGLILFHENAFNSVLELRSE